MSSSAVEIKQTAFYVYVYLSIIPKKIKNKKFPDTRVLCCMVLEFTMLEYRIIFFNCPIPPQHCHSGKTSRNSSLRNSSTIKSGISLYSSETVFFYYKFLKMVVFSHFGLLLLPYHMSAWPYGLKQQLIANLIFDKQKSQALPPPLFLG